MTHLDHLLRHVPDLEERRILDIGAGRGGFVVDAVSKGFTAVGVEYNPDYIRQALEYASSNSVDVTITQGAGESLPFQDDSFGFVNLSEVLEHVERPHAVLNEIYRVLSLNGMAYISIPSRYGMFDPHYHLVGINWLPRSVGTRIANALRQRSKGTEAGQQDLDAMHYYSFSQAYALLSQTGFTVLDVREERIKAMNLSTSLRLCALGLYYFVKGWFFSTLHFMVIKK